MEVKINITQSDGSVVEVIKQVDSVGDLGNISVTESWVETIRKPLLSELEKQLIETYASKEPSLDGGKKIHRCTPQEIWVSSG
jgi:hypothetical protein